MNAARKRPFFAPPDSDRCTAWVSTSVKREGARCMRRRVHGTVCKQHHALSLSTAARKSAEAAR